MKIHPYQRLCAPAAKQNFNSVCSVSCAYVDGEYYGYRQHEVLHDAASALSAQMHQGTLEPDIREKVYKYFPDFTDKGPTATACHHKNSKGKYFSRQNWSNVLTGYDAIKYRDCTFPDDTPDEKKAKQLDTFEKILKDSPRVNELCVFAKTEEKKVKGIIKKVMTVTDIKLASEVTPVRGKEHTYKA